MRLATITLDATIIGKIMSESQVDLEAEAKVEQVYRLLPVVQRIAEEASRSAVESMLLALLQDRFGKVSGLGLVAGHLADRPDRTAALHLITSADSVADLRRQIGN